MCTLHSASVSTAAYLQVSSWSSTMHSYHMFLSTLWPTAEQCFLFAALQEFQSFVFSYVPVPTMTCYVSSAVRQWTLLTHFLIRLQLVRIWLSSIDTFSCFISGPVNDGIGNCQCPRAGKPSRCVTSYPGQLSLAILLCIEAVITSK